MTDYKKVKNEQWTVEDIYHKINNKLITKPRFQRKKKWDIIPKKDNIPNEKSFIEFLYKTTNSVQPITIGTIGTIGMIYSKGTYSNIDGNNRINAIMHFRNKPFEIFSEYLEDIIKFINECNIKESTKDLLKSLFSNLSYVEIMSFNYKNYFTSDNLKQLYEDELKILRDDFESYIEKIQDKLKLNNQNDKKFNTDVKINVNIFEGYNTNELCEMFRDMNKYNSKLTETELLASILFNDDSFDINDIIIKTEIIESIKEYYNNKSENEVLECYKFNPDTDKINAHDFIVGFQNYCSKKYDKIIPSIDVKTLPLFFKLFGSSYDGFSKKNISNFTTDNVNEFINSIIFACNILEKTIKNIFTDKINEKLFNKTCKDKLEKISKNSLYLLISAINGFRKKNIEEKEIIKYLEKTLIFHFFISDIKDKERKDKYLLYDKIKYTSGGGTADNDVKKLILNPEELTINIKKEIFIELIKDLINENNNPYLRRSENGNISHDKRRPLKFFEKTLMFYYYKNKIPINLLNKEFSIEHIFPNSCDWNGELDKDRIGNLIPIISSMNSGRGNKHIDNYKNTPEGNDFCDYIKDIIPNCMVYDSIVIYQIQNKIKKPFIKDNEKYKNLCEQNELIYTNNIIECLY